MYGISEKWPIRYKTGRDTEPGQRLVVEAGLHQLGDQSPHFSVTAELIDKSKKRRADGGVIACGAMHDEIVRWFPKLAPVIALHLSDDHGVPMHAQANARYWMGLTGFKTWERNYGHPEPLPAIDVLARHLRITEDEASKLCARFPAQRSREDITEDGDALTAVIDAMRPHWQAEADAAVALLTEMGAVSR